MGGPADSLHKVFVLRVRTFDENAFKDAARLVLEKETGRVEKRVVVYP